MPTKVLVVDDDRKMVDLMRAYLERDGYGVISAYDGEAALDLARQKRPDLVILDVMLPKASGLDVCRAIQESQNTPVILVTARTSEEDKLDGLAMGADDYLTKPFSPRELVARVRTVLRRVRERSTDGDVELRHGDLRLVRESHEAWRGSTPLDLTPKEYKLLETLMLHPRRAFSRLDLLDQVFGLDYEGLERTVDTHIRNLRKKIEVDPANPRHVVTVFGVGYRLGGPIGD